MSKTIFLKREDCYCNLIIFYENVAKKLSFKVTDETEFDCRKICVTKPVQETIWAYYREQEEEVDSDIAALWLFCGPKANLEYKDNLYVVNVEFGFVLPR